MANEFHKNLVGTDNHVIHTWTYANQAAREAATGFASGDIGKVSYQTDNNTMWILTATTPTWKEITNTGIGTDETVKVTVNDTTQGFLNSKITVGSTKISKTTVNPGGNESIALDVVESNIAHANLSGVGTNSHTQIDSHIASVNPHIDWTVDQGATNIHPGNYTDTVYSHPNHTGEVTSTGDGAQVLNKTAISNKTAVTVAGSDEILIGDVSDTGNLKKVTAQAIADLSSPNTDVNVKVSANDTTTGYLEDKIVATEGIQKTTLNDGGDEDVQFKLNIPGLTLGEPDRECDYFVFWDNSAGVHKKTKVSEHEEHSQWKHQTIDKDLTIAPGTPLNRDQYIVGTGASGAWVGQDGKIATWNTESNTWIFYGPVEGDFTWILDEDKLYRYLSAWGEYRPDSSISHTSISNIGTNTHAQIDTHIASTSNPHSTTAGQVGNATAQWNANKLQGVEIDTTAPTNGQVLKYNSGTSKWEPGTDVSGSGGLGSYEYASSEGESTTTSMTYQSKVTKTSASLSSGKTYKFTWSAQVGHADAIDACQVRFRVGSTTYADPRSARLAQDGDYTHLSGSVTLTGLSGATVFDLFFKSAAGGIAKIKYARIDIQEVI